MFPSLSPHVRALVQLALDEDLPGGDVTTALTIDPSRTSRAFVRAKQGCVVCGTDIIALVFDLLGEPVKIRKCVQDGMVIRYHGTPVVLVEVRGRTAALLAAERTILNFMQRLSGVATHTREIIAGVTGITVLDTRKTTPGFRQLEKYAVRIGGAQNHRSSLSDMVLVKNNHVDAGGGMKRVLTRVYAGKAPAIPVEVEVRTMAELRVAASFEPEFIMLDNMSDPDVGKAVNYLRTHAPRTRIEASGGISKERLATLAASGVQFVSMGSLTTRAVNVDISMKIE